MLGLQSLGPSPDLRIDEANAEAFECALAEGQVPICWQFLSCSRVENQFAQQRKVMARLCYSSNTVELGRYRKDAA